MKGWVKFMKSSVSLRFFLEEAKFHEIPLPSRQSLLSEGYGQFAPQFKQYLNNISLFLIKVWAHYSVMLGG